MASVRKTASRKKAARKQSGRKTAARKTAARKTSPRAPALIILIRHAEKPGETKATPIDDSEITDPYLSSAGYYRAGAYSAYFDAKKNGGLYPKIDSIFATKATRRSNRPFLTVAPLGAAVGKTVNVDYDNKPDGIAKLAATLLGGKYAGQTVLICWHHGTMPALAAALGYPNAPKIPRTSFDVVWKLAYSAGTSTPSFSSDGEHLMYGDTTVAVPGT